MFTSVLKIIPFVFFGIPLLFIFGLFISGAFTLFFTNETDRGKDIIAKALTYFLILLALFLVFTIVSYLVRQGQIFNPKEAELEFPISPMGRFPSAPEFVMVEDYSFSGPWPVPQVDIPDSSYVYGIFCKKEQGYDIIDLGISYKRRAISSSKNYSCWEENCNGSENIYIGFYWASPDDPYLDRELFNEIKEDVDFICSPKL